MVLHVIWGFVDELAQECPTFSVTGVMLQCDRVPAHVKQGRFRWAEDAWEAEIEVSRVGAALPLVSGIIRLSPSVWTSWTHKSLNPRSEAARQLRDVVQSRGWATDLGVITFNS
jgi:hypothetical protein